MRRSLLLFTVPAILLATLYPGVVRSQGDTEGLTLSILTCPKAIALGTTASATLYQGEWEREVGSVPLQHTAQNLYTGNSQVHPGHYTLSVQDGFCVAHVAITVLAKRDRNVGLVLREGSRTHYDAHAYVAGTLPIAGISSATLMSKNGAATPLIVDRSAYYGEHLADGSYTLVLYFSEQDLQCRLPVAITGTGSIVDVGPSDITRTIGYLLRYPGKPSEFQLLYHNEIH
jgi:hypothetical protein